MVTRKVRYILLFPTLLLGALLLLPFPANSQVGDDLGPPAPPVVNGPRIVFDKPGFDWGEVVQGEIIEHSYRFRNIGTEVLRITQVKPG